MFESIWSNYIFSDFITALNFSSKNTRTDEKKWGVGVCRAIHLHAFPEASPPGGVTTAQCMCGTITEEQGAAWTLAGTRA